VPFVLAGLAAAGAMVIFNWRSKRWTDMSA